MIAVTAISQGRWRSFLETFTNYTGTMKIVRIITRHHFGCFTVEDESGKHHIVQQAMKIEDQWRVSQGLEPMGF